MGPKLKTTTAVLACLNLAMPYPALAQSAESQAIQDAVEACREPNSDACLEATDRALQAQEGETAQAGEEGPDAAAEGEPVTAPETADSPETSDAPTEAVTSETAEEEMPEAAEAPTEAPAAPEEAAAPETADEEMPEAVEVPAEEAAPAAPEETAAPETTGGTSAPEAPDATGPEAVESAPDVPAATEAPAETRDAEARTGTDTEADAPAEAATGAEDTATEAAPEESAAEVPEGTGAAPASEMTDDADAAPAQGSDTAASPEPATDSAPEAAEEADEDTAATPSPGAPAAEDDTAGTDDAMLDDAMRDAMGEAETEQADTAAPAAPQSDADAATPAADQAEADPAQGDPEDEANPEEQARSGAAPAAAAATAQDAEPEDVVSRTVTEADARSSSEDFDTAIEDDATAQASAESDDDGDGMSTLEKALLLGAGALAVGTLVRGNREVVAASEDRVVVTDSSGAYQLIKDDNALLARPGTEVQTQTFDDGSTRTTVLREDGSQIVTIRDASLRVLRRERVTPDGQRILLIDDTQDVQPVELANLQPAQTQASVTGTSDEEALRQALAAEGGFDRAYSLSQIRNIAEVRYQVPAIDLDSITFESGSAAIDPEQAEQLTALGRLIRERIASDPTEIFLVEGHTDATGDAAYNLALSDRRAESVALALSEYFDVPPENLVVQGYGERFLKVETEAAERGNRRATVRRITQLLQVAAAQ